MRYDAGEVITAMVTPFNEKREVDYEKGETCNGYDGRISYSYA